MPWGPHNHHIAQGRKKPLLQICHKKAKLQFAGAPGDRNQIFYGNVLWSDETNIELLGHNDHHYVLMKKVKACKWKNAIPTVKNGCGNIMSCVVCCKNENCVIILNQHLKIGLPNVHILQTPSKLWQNDLRTIKSRYWSGHHKSLTSV